MATKETVKIIKNEEISPQHFKLTFHSEEFVKQAKPGQFVMVKVEDGTIPLLRRPLGIHRINKEKDEVELLYKVVGKGTGILSNKKPGKKINIIGPLGTNFKIDKTKDNYVIIAGGIGIVPLVWLAEKLAATQKPLYIVLGAKTKHDLICKEELKALTQHFHTITEDGSSGKKGIISDYLANILHAEFPYKQTQIFSCGPTPLLKYVADFAVNEEMACQLSLEEKMACGIGICVGCVVKTTSGYKKVCKDGPIFDAKEILWQT